jgi:general secretion pathway protein A
VSAPQERRTLVTALKAAAEAAGPWPAFARVLAQWGVPVPAGPEAPCEAVARAGLQCLEGRGTWRVVSRLDLPMVLTLTLPDRGRRYAAVTRLDDERVTLELEDGVLVAPRAEVDALWDGTFAVVWRPPAFGAQLLAVGARGRPVVWLRQGLDQLQGGGGLPASDVYDEALAARVVAFQRRHALDPDGIVGMETLARLTASLDPQAPSLSGPR